MQPITVFCDYLCPYVYRASEWLASLERLLADPPQVNWRFFSLAQVNHRINDGWQVWSQPGSDPGWEKEDYARGLRFFWAAAAAQRQGSEAFRALHDSLLRTIHADRRELGTFDALVEVAAAAGLEVSDFGRDLRDPACLAQLGVDHQAGTDLKVFGTPTFVIREAAPAYLKLTRIPNDREAVDLWASFSTVVADQPYVLEIKRPQ